MIRTLLLAFALFVAAVYATRFTRAADPAPPASEPASRPAELSEAQAITAATEYVRARGMGWGDPTGASQQRECYWVTFPTSAHETALLGPRTVVVNIHTGKCVIQERE